MCKETIAQFACSGYLTQQKRK